MTDQEIDWTRKMTSFLTGKICPRRETKYIQPVFDPVQTHGLYDITKDDVPKLKEALKKLGANKFRTVKCSHSSYVILCFNASKVQLTK